MGIPVIWSPMDCSDCCSRYELAYTHGRSWSSVRSSEYLISPFWQSKTDNWKVVPWLMHNIYTESGSKYSDPEKSPEGILMKKVKIPFSLLSWEALLATMIALMVMGIMNLWWVSSNWENGLTVRFRNMNLTGPQCPLLLPTKSLGVIIMYILSQSQRTVNRVRAPALPIEEDVSICLY